MKVCFSSPIVLLAIVFILGRPVSGKCGDGSMFDSPWAACLPSSDSQEEKCPHNFLQLEGNRACNQGRTFNNIPYVCCLLTPTVDLRIKDAPCLSSDQSTAPSTGTRKSHHKED